MHCLHMSHKKDARLIWAKCALQLSTVAVARSSSFDLGLHPLPYSLYHNINTKYKYLTKEVFNFKKALYFWTHECKILILCINQFN